MIKNIIFDFGGVIVDINRDNAVKRFIELGIADADELLDKYHQKGIFLEVEDGRITADEFCNKLGELAHREITFDTAKYGWLGFMEEVPLYRLTYLEELRKKYNLYLLSNTNPFIMSWARSKDFTSMGKPLDNYFDKLYLSFEIGTVKPHKEIFDYMISDASLNPAECIFVDDGSANVEVGKKLGFRVMKPLNGEDWRNKLDELL